MKKIFTTFIILVFLINTNFSQNSTKKFAFGVSGAFTDFISLDSSFTLHKIENMNFFQGPVNFNLAYNIIKPINIATGVTFGDISKYNKPLTDNSYWKWDAGVQVRFLSFFMNDDHWFDPYLFANGGIFHLNNQKSPVVNGGLGFNFWLNEYFALNVATGYNYGFNLDKSFNETTFGIKLRIGEGEKDSDGDGIVDSKDKCPNVPGYKEYDGCPEINADKKKEIEDNIRLSANNIEFNTNKSIIRESSYKDIDNIVLIMNLYPKIKFNIEGHTDNTGDYDYNKKLSQERAEAVKTYIVNKGISSSRLTSKGFGSDKPIASNDTSEGRQKNRRVEFVIVK